MNSALQLPTNPLVFIQDCVRNEYIFWTYHVNMRLQTRGIIRKIIIESVDNYQVIEEYPEDKYLPSFLIWTHYEKDVYHVLFALDIENRNVRIVTAYRPDPVEWDYDLKRRKVK